MSDEPSTVPDFHAPEPVDRSLLAGVARTAAPYRLTTIDETAIRGKLAATATGWVVAGLRQWHKSDYSSLARVGARAIGCPLDALRPPEVEWVRVEAHKAASMALHPHGARR